MTSVNLTINGKGIKAEIEPRLHLADYLRESLNLTATHIGCEHGVCGACTILIDGQPARSCIAYPAALDGADIRTIEGLRDDPVVERLRLAFKQEHALQCGYCTPGMLVTARDIVLRLPQADEPTIRLELAGNLCRCTGYTGIVRAIQRVLGEEPKSPIIDAGQAIPDLVPLKAARSMPAMSPAVGGVLNASPRNVIKQSLEINRPRPEVWVALQDATLIAACLPGAHVISVLGEKIEGSIDVALGPVNASIKGTAFVQYDDGFQGTVRGDGSDQKSQSRLSANMNFRLLEKNEGTSKLEFEISYALRGSLAQLGRPAIITAFANEIGTQFARNLDARLAGESGVVVPARLNGLDLAWKTFKSVVLALFGKRNS